MFSKLVFLKQNFWSEKFKESPVHCTVCELYWTKYPEDLHCHHNLWATYTTCTHWSFNHRFESYFFIWLVKRVKYIEPSRRTSIFSNNRNNLILPQTGNYDCYSVFSGERKYYISSHKKKILLKCIYYRTQCRMNRWCTSHPHSICNDSFHSATNNCWIGTNVCHYEIICRTRAVLTTIIYHFY